MRRLLLTAAAATAAALTLAACGTTEPAADKTEKKASEAITLKDGKGTEVKLDGPATKVVATEWNVVESLVQLGVDPVGVADVKGYETWDTAAPLRNEPKDIGTRGEPSMDTVASLAPDLIVATTDLPPAAVKQLREVAPVLEVTSADGTDQIGQMLENVDLIDQRINQGYVYELHESLDDGSGRRTETFHLGNRERLVHAQLARAHAVRAASTSTQGR